MHYYKWDDYVSELDPSGYLINDGRLAKGLHSNRLFTYEVNYIHKVIDEFANSEKD